MWLKSFFVLIQVKTTQTYFLMMVVFKVDITSFGVFRSNPKV